MGRNDNSPTTIHFIAATHVKLRICNVYKILQNFILEMYTNFLTKIKTPKNVSLKII